MTAESFVPEPASPEIMRAAERHGLGSLRRILTRHRTVDTRHPEHYYTRAEVTIYICEFEHGIVYEHHDKKVYVYPWKRVSHVYLASTRNFKYRWYAGTDYSGLLVLADGGHLKLNGSFHDPAYRYVHTYGKKTGPGGVEYELFRLMSAASTVVSQLQLPDALAKLERGEALPFGDISISLAGIQAGKAKDLVPWPAVQDVRLSNGAVEVKQAGKFRLPSRQQAGKIPNLPLFLTLVDTIRRNQRQ